MLNIIAVFLGGGIGSLFRYFVNILFTKYDGANLPFATLFVNITGSFILGILFVFFMQKTNLHPAWRLALSVGFCGGLTTFSTFSVEAFELLKNSQFLIACIYILASVSICILAAAAGYCIGGCIGKYV